MRILERYITTRFIKNFFAGLLVFLSLYLIVDIFSKLEDIIANHAPLQLVIKYYLAMVPIIIAKTGSLAALLAALITCASMNIQNEIVAIRASGQPLRRIVIPLILPAFLAGIALFYVNEQVAPQNNLIAQNIKNEIIQRNKNANDEKIILRNLAFYSTGNQLFFISKYHVQENKIIGLVILKHNYDQDLVEKWVAQEAIWLKGKWAFKNLMITKYVNGSVKQDFYETFESELGVTPVDIMKSDVYLESLNISSLINHINRLKKSQAYATILNFKVKLFERLALPFIPLALILSGIPFVITIQRKPAGFASIANGIILFFIFFTMESIALSIGKTGVIAPFISAFLIPIIFTIFGILMFFSIP